MLFIATSGDKQSRASAPATMPRWCGFRRRLGDLGDHLVAQMAL